MLPRNPRSFTRGSKLLSEKEQEISATAAAKKHGEDMVDAVKQEIVEAGKLKQKRADATKKLHGELDFALYNYEEALAATKAQNEAIGGSRDKIEKLCGELEVRLS